MARERPSAGIRGLLAGLSSIFSSANRLFASGSVGDGELGSWGVGDSFQGRGEILSENYPGLRRF